MTLTNDISKQEKSFIVITCNDEVSSKIKELASLLSKAPKSFVKVINLAFDRIDTFQSFCAINTDRCIAKGTININYVSTHFLNELLIALRTSDFDVAVNVFHKSTPVKLDE